jgi:hypothetical protein
MKLTDVSPQVADIAQRYHYEKSPEFFVTIQKIIYQVLRAISEFLSSLQFRVPAFYDMSPVGNLIRFSVLIVGFLCVAVFVYILYLRLQQLNRKRKVGVAGIGPPENTLNSLGWQKQAQDLAKNQEWKRACRALYLSCLQKLDEDGVLKFAPTKTNYEYLYAMSAHKTLQKLFRDLFNDVESIWFGQEAATKEHYERSLRNLEVINQETDRIGQSQKNLLSVTKTQ